MAGEGNQSRNRFPGGPPNLDMLILGKLASVAGGTAPQVLGPATFIDALNGLDTNPGTNALPLKTYSQAVKRRGLVTGLISTPFTVTLKNTVAVWPANDPIIDVVPKITGLNGLWYVKTQPIIDLTGTITAVQLRNRPANTVQTITSAPVDFTAHVGRRIRLTSGPNAGAVAYIAAAAGPGPANVATCSEFILFNTTTLIGTAVQPANGNTFQIEHSIQFDIFDITNLGSPIGFNLSAQIIYEGFDIVGNSGLFGQLTGDTWMLRESRLRLFFSATMGLGIIENCIVNNGDFLSSLGSITVHSGLFLNNTGPFTSFTGGGRFVDDIMMLGCTSNAVTLQGDFELSNFIAMVGCDAPILALGNTFVIATAAAIYGTGNTNSIIDISGKLFYPSVAATTVFTATSGARDFRLGTAVAGPAINPAAPHAFSAGDIAYTWGNLAAAFPGGFSGHAANVFTPAQSISQQ